MKTAKGMTNNAMFLHGTEVARLDGAVLTLKTGGYKTATTKKYMNQFLEHFDINAHVFADKGRWYVSFNGHNMPFDTDTFRFDLHAGSVID